PTAVAFCCIFLGSLAHAQPGADEAWLRYQSLQAPAAGALPHWIAVVGRGEVLPTAAKELADALGHPAAAGGARGALPDKDAFVLGTWKNLQPLFPELGTAPGISGDGFWLKTIHRAGSRPLAASKDSPAGGQRKYWLVIGADEPGVLYGTFALLARIAGGLDVSTLDDRETPSAPIRWVNQWDNLDGSIERGYAGRSIFFENGSVSSDLTRASEYARLLASIGINGCAINNVNADPRLLKPDYLPQLVRVAEAF